MIEDLPLVSINVRIYKFWSILLRNTWRSYFCYTLCFLLNISQIIDMFVTEEPIEIKIRYAYGLALWFDTNIRGVVLGYRRFAYENFIQKLEMLYIEIKDNATDRVIKNLLEDTTTFIRKLSITNLLLGSLVVCGFNMFPLLLEERALPYSFYVPYVDKLKSPSYEIIYIYMIIATPIGCLIYIPLSNLIVTFLMFGILMCKILQHRLLHLYGGNNSELELMNKIVGVIQNQLKLIDYINHFNSLISYLFLAEFVIFGAILCALLFMFLIVNDVAQTIIVVVFILMIFSQIAAFSWFANELYEESLKVSLAAYSTDWFNYTQPVKKAILMLIIRSQVPLAMKIGMAFDLNLKTFQSLLNTTYSTFTLLRRLY